MRLTAARPPSSPLSWQPHADRQQRLQTAVILISHNRQAEKHRLIADLDGEVNLKAELKITMLHEQRP